MLCGTFHYKTRLWTQQFIDQVSVCQLCHLGTVHLHLCYCFLICNTHKKGIDKERKEREKKKRRMLRTLNIWENPHSVCHAVSYSYS